MPKHDGSINYARDLSEHPLDEPRNKRGQTLGEHIETLRGVFASLKSDLFYHMARKKDATDMGDFLNHEAAIKRISKALATARKRATSLGIKLD